MKDKLLLLRNQLKMGHRISFTEAMLLQRAIDILVNKAGNSPAQSDCRPAQNQGWIPVSEQMPEVGDIVLTAMGGVVNVGETECSAANCRFFTSVISGRELPATHWMQLPVAPQEVKP
ncbi:DUF551 domain-containing protein [Klebsiella quasipneumoniae]|uniref:DUF551 domain-containing protein n=1 Tax=Klebsiella quasipneumoniae TaxID=1463165 RepID=UPI001F5490A2|nr:DUF551 domain-containing protein [Klebsiella quasipneumoniae]